MSIEILTIGDELMRGDLVDTNAGWLAARLHEAGLVVSHIGSTGDDFEALGVALRQAIERSRIVITSGGLGPTDDDRTIAALASVCGRELELDQTALEHIKGLFSRIGLTFTPNNEKQAWIPKGATALLNERGTAPCVHLPLDGCDVFCLPGVPRELEWLYGRYIGEFMQQSLGVVSPQRRVIKFFGVGESHIDHAIADLLPKETSSSVSVHFRATFPETHVTVLVASNGETEQAASRQADELAASIAQRLPRHVFWSSGGSGSSQPEQSFSDAVVSRLKARNKSVALAESCTGGLVGNLITQASGASEVFELGIVAYANRIKHQFLGVSEQVLQQHGAVSQACVEAMASGVRERADADFGIAISGIAGPTGGTKEKPVGTIHFALADRGGTVRHLHRVFPYDRTRNKQLAAHVALWLLFRALDDEGEHIADERDAHGADLLSGRWLPQKGDKAEPA
jgi:nicotinamide-nucleotide amidase